MSTLVKHNQALNVGTDRIIVVGNDETNHVKNDRQLTVDLNDNVVIGGTHDKTITDVVTQIYGSDHSRKVDGNQLLVAEENKDEHVKQAHKLTTDKKFQLNQGPTSMTFKGGNVTVDSAGTITLQANGATVCLDKTGKASFDSPTGIKFVVGGSSLAILPGGVVLASPAVTAAAGGAGSVVSMGEDAVAMKSKTVTIEADGVCSIKGKSALKLQEAEGPKGKKSQSSGTPKTETDRAKVQPPSPKAKKGRGVSKADVQGGTAPENEAAQNKGDPAREKGPLWVRVDMLPKHAEQVAARFVLTSSDQSNAITLTVRDDMEPGNETVDLLFKDLWKDLSYSLRVEDGSEAAEVVFENVPYDQLASLAGTDQGGDSNGNDTDIEELEAVRPSSWAGIDASVSDGEDA